MEENPDVSADRKCAIWRAGEVWPHDLGALIEFFSTPHSSLDGSTPDAVIEQGGIKRVMMIIDKIEAELRR